jgi:hypothetical protein
MEGVDFPDLIYCRMLMNVCDIAKYSPYTIRDLTLYNAIRVLRIVVCRDIAKVVQHSFTAIFEQSKPRNEVIIAD